MLCCSVIYYFCYRFKIVSSISPATKKKKEKRAKLLDWMKRKQKERSKEYLQQLEVKREQEFRPFVPKVIGYVKNL